MPIFVENLEVVGSWSKLLFAGLAISVSAISAALFLLSGVFLLTNTVENPMMIRAGLAMTITMGGIGFNHKYLLVNLFFVY